MRWRTTAVVVISIAVAVWAELNRQEAQRQRDASLVLQSRYISQEASRLCAAGNCGEALALGLEVLPTRADSTDRPWDLKPASALQEALWYLRERRLLVGHTGPLESSQFSKDGSRALTTAWDFTARLWDVSSGRLLTVFKGHRGLIWRAALSNDGSQLLTIAADKTSRLWNAQTGKELQTLTLRGDAVLRDVTFMPDGRRFAAGSMERTSGLIQYWDSTSLHEYEIALPDGGNIAMIRFSPSGSKAIVSGDKGTAAIIDVESGKQVVLLQGHGGSALSMVFSPDEAHVLTFAKDRTARLWDVSTGREQATIPVDAELSSGLSFTPDGKLFLIASRTAIQVVDSQTTAKVWDVSRSASDISDANFSPDGTSVVAACGDTARVWDLKTSRETVTLAGHKGAISNASFSPDGTQVLTSSWDASARLWNAAALTDRKMLPANEGKSGIGHFVFASVFPDGKRVITANGDQNLAKIWDADSGRQLRTLEGHEAGILSVALSTDGHLALTTSIDGTSKLWDTEAGREVRTIKATVVALSPTGDRLAIAMQDGALVLMDLSTGKEVVAGGHASKVSRLAFSLDGSVLLSKSDDSVRVWQSKTGRERTVLRGYEGQLYGVAFSPDAGLVVTTSDDGMAWIWDTETGRVQGVLGDRRSGIVSAEFSPRDEKSIVTSSFIGMLATATSADVWDLATLKHTARLVGHQAGIGQARFSPDGKVILTASADGTARLWDPGTGQNLAVLRGHNGPVRFVFFSGDGSRMATSSDDGTVGVWSVAHGQALLNRACQLRPYDLSETQRDAYFLSHVRRSEQCAITSGN